MFTAGASAICGTYENYHFSAPESQPRAANRHNLPSTGHLSPPWSFVEAEREQDLLLLPSCQYPYCAVHICSSVALAAPDLGVIDGNLRLATSLQRINRAKRSITMLVQGRGEASSGAAVLIGQ